MRRIHLGERTTVDSCNPFPVRRNPNTTALVFLPILLKKREREGRTERSVWREEIEKE